MDARLPGVDTDDVPSRNAIDTRNLVLLKRDARQRALLDELPLAVYITDRAGVIQSFNRRAAELWGREPERSDTAERFWGNFKLFRPHGTLVLYPESPNGTGRDRGTARSPRRRGDRRAA